MTEISTILKPIVRNERAVVKTTPQGSGKALARPLGALRAAGRQTGFVIAIEFALCSAMLAIGMFVVMALVG